VIRRVYVDLARRRAAEGRLAWLARAAARAGLVRLSALARRPLCGPILGTLVTNYTCTLRCGMCDLPARGARLRAAGLPELDARGMAALLEGFAAIGTLGVGFTGGEPLLRPEIWDLLERCRALGMLSHLNTNATLLDEAAARRMLAVRVDSLNVSLDGATAATHERIRGAGTFAPTLAAVQTVVRLAREARAPLRLKLVMVCQEENVAEVPAFLALAEELGVACAEIIPRQPFRADAGGGGAASPALLAAVDRMVAGLRARRGGVALENSGRMLGLFAPAFRGAPSPLACYAGWSSLAADCHGRLFPCVPYVNWERPFATLADPRDLPAAWRDRGAAWRGEVSRCRACTLNCQAELNLLLAPLKRVR
jgi:MoaA/NifB/PqqE/SkfB family radical SAM enzyme